MESEWYVRILGSNQEVVRFMWLIKYVSPALVIACSQPSGSGPSCPIAFVDLVIAGLTANKKENRLQNAFDWCGRAAAHCHACKQKVFLVSICVCVCVLSSRVYCIHWLRLRFHFLTISECTCWESSSPHHVHGRSFVVRLYN